MTPEPRLEVAADKPDVSSPLGRLAEAQKHREKTRTDFLPVTGYSDGFEAEIGLLDSPEAASAGLRLIGVLQGSTIQPTLEDAALVVATSVVGLYTPSATGEREKVIDGNGQPVRFDERYGQAVGVPDIKTGEGAVFAVFSQGMKLDAQSLMAFATAIAGWSMGLDAEDTVKGS